MNKRILVICLSFLILFICVFILISNFGEKSLSSEKKVIITTIYLEYDFAKAIVGDKFDVVRLIGPGIEVHTYEPSVKDMKRISDADMFIYTGNAMEPWVEGLMGSIDNKDLIIVDCSKNIDLIESDEFMEDYSILDEEHEEGLHNEEYDGHIWMNPQNAIIMINTILDEIIKIDSENEEIYKANALKYINEIINLDTEIEEMLKENNIEVLVFGGEFAYAYFCKHYDIKVVSCYTACGEGGEPSITRVKKVIDFINKNNIPNIFYEELSEGKLSEMISQETNSKAKVFNTLHNVSNDEINNNSNYISIMKENLLKICSK